MRTLIPSVQVHDLYNLNWPLNTWPFLNWKLCLPESYASPVSSAVCILKGVPIITAGSLKSRKNGNPGMPIFTRCVYFHDTSPNLPVRWNPHREPRAPLSAFALCSISTCQCQCKRCRSINASGKWLRRMSDLHTAGICLWHDYLKGVSFEEMHDKLIVRTRSCESEQKFPSFCLYPVMTCTANLLCSCNSIFIYTFVFLHSHLPYHMQ